MLHGCSLVKSNFQPKGQKLLKIALIADSQFFSKQARPFRPKSLWNSQSSDFITNVTLRTVVQNELSEHSLRELLKNTIENKQPDIILYLGDGANSGCRDELEPLFKVLGEHEFSSTPIFYVLGNHDYLGAGNTSNISTRNMLCTPDVMDDLSKTTLSSNSLSKYSAIKMIHNFNYRSVDKISTLGFEYVDNYSDSLVEACEKNGVVQHGESDCFYAAYLENDFIELFLLDSSNYGNESILYSKVKQAVIEFKDHSFSGISGFISSKQWEWLTNVRKKRAFNRRMVFASHYPPSDIGIFGNNTKSMTVKGGKRGRAIYFNKQHNKMVKPLFSLIKNSSDMPVWLSAHTHVRQPELSGFANILVRNYTAKDRRKVRKFHTFNVGSTTDYDQHTLVIDLHEISATSQAVRLIDESQESTCGDLILRIEKHISANEEKYMPVKTKSSYLSYVGMTTDYRTWEYGDYINAAKNLKNLMTKLELNRLEKSCLIYTAAKNEDDAFSLDK
tara:strand:- start:2707 stop:4215 length:1509 start_codon:yes stop_codon:yes gene_type:complete